MRCRSILLAASLALPGCGQAAGSDESDLIHGQDDRHDVFEHPDARLVELAKQSIVALVREEHIDASDPANVTFDTETLADKRGLCPGEAFATDPAIAKCSGTLIGDDLVLTAAHCLAGPSCDGLDFVFGVYHEAEGQLHRVTADDVFHCAGLLEVDGLPAFDRPRDVAVVRLDRPATPRFTPVPVRGPDEALPKGQRLATIGFPWGAPAKIESVGRVTSPRADSLDYFLTDQDIFRGNSGSGVFDHESLELVGVVIEFEKLLEETVTVGPCEAITNVEGDEGTTRVAYARHVPGFGACASPLDTKNLTYDTFSMLGVIDACDSPTLSLPIHGSVPGDAAWRWAAVEGVDACGSDVVLTPSHPGVQLCAYTSCWTGAATTELACSGQLTVGPQMQPGCCSAPGEPLTLQPNCGPSQNDGMFLHMLSVTPNTGGACTEANLLVEL